MYLKKKKACKSKHTNFRLGPIRFFRKSWRLWDNVEKYGRAKHVTDENIIKRMRFACWITKDTHTYKYFILSACPRHQWIRKGAWIVRYTHTVLFRGSIFNHIAPFPLQRLYSNKKSTNCLLFLSLIQERNKQFWHKQDTNYCFSTSETGKFK